MKESVANLFGDLVEAHEDSELSAGYSNTRTFELRMRLRSRLLAGHAPPWEAAHILDVGCNNGCSMDEFLRAGARVCGVDVVESAVGLACRRGVDARVAESTSLPFEDGMFDYVSMTEVVQYLDAPAREASMNEMLRVTRSGGLISILAPNLECLARRVYRPKDHFAEHYSIAELHRLLSRAARLTSTAFATYPIFNFYPRVRMGGVGYQLSRWLFPLFGALYVRE